MVRNRKESLMGDEKKIVTTVFNEETGEWDVELRLPYPFDLAGRLDELTTQGWYWQEGVLQRLGMAESHRTPWLHSPVGIEGMTDEVGDCKYTLQAILFDAIYQKQHVPLFCQECYKVVAVPRDLSETLVIYEWQQSTPWASKCGPEMRPYVGRLWGAYWYCRGVEEGRERYKVVRAWLDENISPDVECFLKRGCTEYEQALGDSSKWEPHPMAERIEADVRKHVDTRVWRQPQSLPVVNKILHRWLKWSKENDTPPTTYHSPEDELRDANRQLEAAVQKVNEIQGRIDDVFPMGEESCVP